MPTARPGGLPVVTLRLLFRAIVKIGMGVIIPGGEEYGDGYSFCRCASAFAGGCGKCRFLRLDILGVRAGDSTTASDALAVVDLVIIAAVPILGCRPDITFAHPASIDAQLSAVF